MNDDHADDSRWIRNRKIAFCIATLLVLGLWIGWAWLGVEWVARIRRGSYGIPDAQELGQTGDLFGGISALFAALALLGVGATAIIQGHTARLLQRQVRDAQRSSEMQLRAYVHVSAAKLVWNGGSYHAELELRNYGQTPAYDVEHWISVTTGATGNPPTFEDYKPDAPPSRTIIGPGSGVQLRAENPVEGSLRTVLGTGVFASFLWGKVTYRDVFGRRHQTTLRFMSTGPASIAGQYVATPEGNEAKDLSV